MYSHVPGFDSCSEEYSFVGLMEYILNCTHLVSSFFYVKYTPCSGWFLSSVHLLTLSTTRFGRRRANRPGSICGLCGSAAISLSWCSAFVG